MIDIGYIYQRVVYYMQNPEQIVPTVSDARQASEIEKMRKAISDLCDAKREVTPENQSLAIEVVCLELARQINIEQQKVRK